MRVIFIAVFSAYPRVIDWSKYQAIADKVGPYILADMAHISGLVAAKVHASHFPYADVIASTTHKTLKGPRDGIVLSNNPDLIKVKLQS